MAVSVCSVVSDFVVPGRLLCPWNFPGKNTGVGCYFLLQGIFLTKGSNLNLLSSALAGGFFTKSATWKCIVLIPPTSIHVTAKFIPFYG